MTLRITKFAGEFAELAAWTGESEAELRKQHDYHENREHWLAWEGDQVVGALYPWLSPDGRHRLYFDKCRAGAYAALAGAIAGECYAGVNVADTEMLAELRAAGFVDNRLEHEYEIPVSARRLTIRRSSIHRHIWSRSTATNMSGSCASGMARSRCRAWA